MKNTKLKLAMLMISMLQPIIGAANSVLSEIRKAFGSISESSVQQLVSIPFLVTVPATILAGRLSLRFPKKKLLLFGIGLTTAAGLFPVFVHDFTLIFISRLFVGVGVGFVIPFMTGLIADFFTVMNETISLACKAPLSIWERFSSTRSAAFSAA